MTIRATWGTIVAGGWLFVTAADAGTSPIRWEPYTYETRTGETIGDGELGHLGPRG